MLQNLCDAWGLSLSSGGWLTWAAYHRHQDIRPDGPNRLSDAGNVIFQVVCELFDPSGSLDLLLQAHLNVGVYKHHVNIW